MIKDIIEKRIAEIEAEIATLVKVANALNQERQKTLTNIVKKEGALEERQKELKKLYKEGKDGD